MARAVRSLEIDPVNIVEPPNYGYWAGADQLGRDILSRLIYDGRVSCSVALAAVCRPSGRHGPLGPFA